MISSVAAIAKTPSANVSSRVVSTSYRENCPTSRSAIPVLRATAGPAADELAVELHERVHEVTADGSRAQDLRQLRVVEQPVGVEGRPVEILAVRDPVHHVVGLGHLVQQLAHLLGHLGHQFRLGS